MKIETTAISVETRIADRTLTLQANKQLFESLIHNVITNAIKHNITGGIIIATLEDSRLDVVSTGTGDALDGDRLFHRFARMSHTTKGSGLGLAIAQQICLLYGWEIRYSFENGVHRFKV